jgi:hypothetical protein
MHKKENITGKQIILIIFAHARQPKALKYTQFQGYAAITKLLSRKEKSYALFPNEILMS